MGIKLKPTEIEILLHNLYNKATGESDNGIPECNLYGEKEPWEIWEACNDGSGSGSGANQKELYVFTKVKKKTVNGSRLDRTVGTGAWKGEDTGIKIYGNESDEGTTTRLVGIRKRFRYESRTVHEGRWIMYEYSLDASTLIHAKFQNYVLCRIKKMDGISEKKRKLGQEENQEIIKVNDDESRDSEPQLHICNKSNTTTKLQREENNNNGGIPATVLTTTTTTTNPDDNTKLPINGDHYIIIDLSDSDDDKLNIIGTTPVEKQLDSPESPSGEFTTIPGILDPNCAVDDGHTDWAKAFAEELTRGQAPVMEETKIDDQMIQMLPNNAYYIENCINYKLLYK